MKFAEMIDMGATEIFVTGLGNAEIVAGSCIRFTMYSEINGDDGVERHTRVHLVWPIEAWIGHRALYVQVLALLMNGERSEIVKRMGKH
jgi:hypothetical protein